MIYNNDHDIRSDIVYIKMNLKENINKFTKFSKCNKFATNHWFTLTKCIFHKYI